MSVSVSSDLDLVVVARVAAVPQCCDEFVLSEKSAAVDISAVKELRVV